MSKYNTSHLARHILPTRSSKGVIYMSVDFSVKLISKTVGLQSTLIIKIDILMNH